MSLVSVSTHSDLGIERLLVPGLLPGPIPARMSLATALSFVLLSVALGCLLIRRPVATTVAQSLAVAVGVIGSLETLGYLYNAPALFQVGPFNSVALHTALTFLVISTGIMWSRPTEGWFKHFAAETASAKMGRRLLVSIYVLLPMAAWLRLRGQ